MKSISGFTFLLKTVLDQTKGLADAIPLDSDFTTIGNFQSNNFDISCSVIDVTSKSTLEWTKVLNERGIISINISGSGFLEDSTTHQQLRQIQGTQEIFWYSLTREDGRTFYVKAKLSALSFEGSHDGAVTFSLNLNSSGMISYKDAGGEIYSTSADRITSFSNLLEDFETIIFDSPSYTALTIPATPQLKKTALTTYIDGLTILNSNKESENYDTVITLDGASTEDSLIVPIILLKTSDLTNRKIQILDSSNEDITEKLNFLQEVTDDTSVDWNGYFLDIVLSQDEEFDIKIQLG